MSCPQECSRRARGKESAHSNGKSELEARFATYLQFERRCHKNEQKRIEHGVAMTTWHALRYSAFVKPHLLRLLRMRAAAYFGVPSKVLPPIQPARLLRQRCQGGWRRRKRRMRRAGGFRLAAAGYQRWESPFGGVFSSRLVTGQCRSTFACCINLTNDQRSLQAG